MTAWNHCFHLISYFFILGPAIADRLIREKKTQITNVEKKYMGLIREKEAQKKTQVIWGQMIGNAFNIFDTVKPRWLEHQWLVYHG